MPHCILETSANVPDTTDLRRVLVEVSHALVATGEFAPAAIKGRAMRREIFVVADGAPDRAFVALEVKILSGRSEEFRGRVAEALLEILKRSFPKASEGGRCSFSAEVSEMDSETYRRYPVPADH